MTCSSNTIRTKFLRASITLIFVLTGSLVWAQSTSRVPSFIVGKNQFQPAQLRADPYELGNRIGMPAVEGDVSVRVLCHAVLDARGATLNTYCYTNKEDDEQNRFVRATLKVMSGTKYFPARVNGARRAATVPVSVLFTRVGRDQSTKVVMNHGQYQVFYGEDYIAAQVYDFGDKQQFARSCGNFTNLKVQLHVGTAGNVFEAAYVGGTASTTCLVRLRQELQRVEAVPLNVDGRAVASRTQMPFFTWVAVND